MNTVYYYLKPIQTYNPNQGYQQIVQITLATIGRVQHQVGGQMFVVVHRDTGVGGALVEGTFLVNDNHARIMFDTGATHSFIDKDFMFKI